MKVTARKEKFLQESLKLIHQKGFKATTMRDLAQHMGFEVSNIYNFIGSKQELLETYLFDVSESFHSGIDNIINSSYQPKEKLRAVISLHISMTTSRPLEIALLVNEWRNLSGEKLEKFTEIRAQYQEKLKSILKEGIDKGEIKGFDLNIMSHTILASVRWLYIWYADHPEAYNPIELERQLTSIVMGGVEG